MQTYSISKQIFCFQGNFDMDDFKRFYSNNDEVESVPYFWQKFDKEHYSIWRCDYKYADELTMVFMSCNLIGGNIYKFYQSQSVAYLNSAPIYVCNYDVTDNTYL